MRAVRSPFRIDVLDANDNLLGGGPITSVLSLTDTRVLDAIGTLEFSMPAGDTRAALITSGVQFDVYDEIDGYLGRYLYKTKEVVDQHGEGMLFVKASEVMLELTWRTVGFRRRYTYDAVDVVVADLIDEAGNWTAEVEAGIGNTSIVYEGENILAAIDALRDRWSKHFRYKAPRVLEFGAFGADSGVRLVNLRGQVQSEINEATNIAEVTRIRLVEESSEIWNSVIPLGAGQGVSQLTIERATLGAYTTLVGVNQDLSNYYYIEDAASVALYGRRTRRTSITAVRPITNSDADIVNAANALKLAAEKYMGDHLSPRVEYQVDVAALRQNVKVGDTVRLAYRGGVDGYIYIDVDEDFFVMDIRRKRDAQSGGREAQMKIATRASRRTSDQDVMLEVIRDLRALKVHLPLTITYSPVGPYIRRMNPSNVAEFTVRISDEVTFLNRAIIRFRTSTLKSSVTGASTSDSTVGSTEAGGSSAPTTSDGGSATLTSGAGGATTESTSSAGEHDHIVAYGVGAAQGYTEYHFSILSLLTGGFYDIDIKTNLPTSDYWKTGLGGSLHSHSVTIPNHTHSVTIAAHSHTVTISSHTHDITIPSHSHTLVYGLFADTTYPQVISIYINGTNQTVALGGTWAATNAAVEVELDVTDILVAEPGGLRQNHRIEFRCASGQGEIEFEMDMMLTIQPIAVS